MRLKLIQIDRTAYHMRSKRAESSRAEPSARGRRRARARARESDKYTRDLKLQCAQATSFAFSVPRTTDTAAPWLQRSCAQRLSSRCERKLCSTAETGFFCFWHSAAAMVEWRGVVTFVWCMVSCDLRTFACGTNSPFALGWVCQLEFWLRAKPNTNCLMHCVKVNSLTLGCLTHQYSCFCRRPLGHPNYRWN